MTNLMAFAKNGIRTSARRRHARINRVRVRIRIRVRIRVRVSVRVRV